jgi:tetratricopeptide (TPR) repeat protein
LSDINKKIKELLFDKASLIQIILGVVTILTSISGFAINLFSNKVNLFVGITGLCIIVFGGLSMLIKSKKKILDISTNTFNKKTRRSFKIGRIGLLIGYVSFLIYLIYPGLSKEQKCMRSGLTTDIFVSNFNNSQGQDNFSYKLTGLLKSKTEFNDSVEVFSTSSIISMGPGTEDTIQREFNKFCSKKGLYVFGRWFPAEKMFDCNILLKNLSNLNYPKYLSGKKPGIIYLQNPDCISFSINDQAEYTATFILSIVLLNLKEYDQSMNLLLSLEKVPGSERSKSIEYYRNFFLGNILLARDKFSESIIYYNKALTIDSSKKYCQYNLAIAYTGLRKYNIAKRTLGSVHGSNRQSLSKFIDENSGIQPISSVHIVSDKNNQKVKMAVNGENVALDKGLKMEKGLDGIQKSTEDKYAVYQNGELIIPFEYTSIEEFVFKNQKFYIVEKNRKFGAFYGNGSMHTVIAQLSAQLVKNIIEVDLDKGNVSF